MASYGAGDGEPGASDQSAEPDRLAAGPAGQALPAWRRWRHTRPFWGGLLIIFGGAEMLLSEQAPLPVIVHVGVQGLAGYLVPIVLVLCGLLIWLNPLQQTFYSVLAILLALGSWITSNLGGFFVGLTLGVTGGALAFAWQRGDEPVPPLRAPWTQPRVTPSEGLSLILGDEATDEVYGDEARDAVYGDEATDPGYDDEPTDPGHGDEAADAGYEDDLRPQPEPPAHRGDGASSGGGRTGSALLAIRAVPVLLALNVIPRQGPWAGAAALLGRADGVAGPGQAAARPRR